MRGQCQRLAVLLVLMLVACSSPPASPAPIVAPNATVEALQARVESLSAELSRVQPSPLPIVVESLLPAVAQEILPTAEPAESIEMFAAEEPEPEPEPTATPRPTAEPTPLPSPTAFPTRTVRPTAVPDATPCRPGQIKANKSSKIYHVPGGASYSRTVNAVECFDTEDQAAAAGYRKARN